MILIQCDRSLNAPLLLVALSAATSVTPVDPQAPCRLRGGI